MMQRVLVYSTEPVWITNNRKVPPSVAFLADTDGKGNWQSIHGRPIMEPLTPIDKSYILEE